MLIEVEDLTAGYARKAVLRNVSFTFAGGATGLLGPNGAGKSTLIKTLLGLIPPMNGTVRVLDYTLPRQAMDVRSRVGYMPENEAFISGINAVNFVAYMAQLSGIPRSAAMERAHEVLQYVGLGESRYRNLETYSMGMKQRAKLAQAIVHDPALLLLDEPTNGMDPPGRAEMLELVADLSRNKGMSVILCSHLLKDVESVSDEIIVMGNGQVVAKRMMRTEPEGGVRVYTVRVRGSREAFARECAAGGVELLDSMQGANLVVRLQGDQSTSLIFQAAGRAQCVVQRLDVHTENLEDLFVQAIGELGHAHL